MTGSCRLLIALFLEIFESVDCDVPAAGFFITLKPIFTVRNVLHVVMKLIRPSAVRTVGLPAVSWNLLHLTIYQL
jgi:hypothetical protein